MNKFIISTDSCCDLFKTYLSDNDVYCIILKRLTDEVESGELFNSFAEYEKFYEDLRGGALPTTSQLSEFELREYFGNILKKEAGDIIHIPLSGGLSGTAENARAAAEKLNAELTERKIYVVDSLSASAGMGMLVDRLIEMRDAGTHAEEAVRIIEDVRDREQVWIIQNSLFHLKRGGRISGFKAAVGTLLSVKPIIIFNDKGRLVIEKTVKGKKKAVHYILKKMRELGADALAKTVYLAHSSAGEFFGEFEAAIKKEFPHMKLKSGMVGPIIGAHLGDGSVAVVFEGAERLKL